MNVPMQMELKKDIAVVLITRTYAEWCEVFAALDCCVEPVLTFSEACQHPHVVARELIVDVKTDSGTQKQLASPVKFSATKPRYDFAGVALGKHTREVLAGAGLSADQIDALMKAGTVM